MASDLGKTLGTPLPRQSSPSRKTGSLNRATWTLVEFGHRGSKELLKSCWGVELNLDTARHGMLIHRCHFKGSPEMSRGNEANLLSAES